MKAYAIDLALVVSQPHGGELVQVEALQEQEARGQTESDEDALAVCPMTLHPGIA